VSPASTLETLPLDDPRWQPMTGVFVQLSQPLGGRHVAEHDINEALALGDLHCLYRYRMVDGLWERRLVSFLCWASHKLMCWGDGVVTARFHNIAEGPPVPRSALDIARRDIHPGGAYFPLPGIIAIDTRIRGVFYGWEPDLQRLWPTVFVPVQWPMKVETPKVEIETPKVEIETAIVESTEIETAKPGSAIAWILTLHPNDWHLKTAGEIRQKAAHLGCKLHVRSFQRGLNELTANPTKYRVK
jgi:hypothetical protein